MSPRHAGRDAGGEGEGGEKPICSYISSFRFQIQDYVHSVERRVFTYLELFFFSIFVHSNLESMRCLLIRSNHSYQVVFKYLLKVLFFSVIILQKAFHLSGVSFILQFYWSFSQPY